METQTSVGTTTYQSVRFQELLTKLDSHRVAETDIVTETVNGSTIQSRVVKIGPALAEALLLNNTNNRPFRKSNLDNLINAMTTGEWVYDAQPIRFDNDGTLLDGQHRLMAIFKSEKSFPFKVLTGFSPEIFTTLDVGAVRNGSDVLAIAGFENHNVLDKCANFVYKFMTKSKKNHANYKNLTHKELIKFVESEPFLVESAQFYADVKKLQTRPVILTQRALAGLHFLLGKKDAFEAKIFLKRLVTAENIQEETPLALLRRRLVDNFFSRNKMNPDDITKLVIHAWNKHRAGKKPNQLKIPKNMPEIK